MKKFIALALTVLMAALVFAACAPAAPAASDAPSASESAAAPSESASAEAEQSSVDKIKEAGELVLLTNAQFPPYEYLGDDNKPAVVDIDIDQMIADELGVELKVVDMDFGGLLTALSGGKGDLVAAGLTITDERKKSVDFCEPYANATQLIIVNKEDPKVSGVDDLAGKTIGVQLGTTGDIYVTDPGMVPDAKVKEYNSGLEAALDLANGKLDAVVLDELPAKSIVASNDALTLIDAPFTEEQYAFAVQKGDTALAEVINKVLAPLVKDGKVAEMTASHAEKYAGTSVDTGE